MNIIKMLRKVSLKNLIRLLALGIYHPLFLLPTLKATKQCVTMANRYYGQLHHQNGPANAFRHALWNFLIAQKCTEWSNNSKKVLAWTKKITDWHEYTFLNDELAQKMDFHNNATGRYLFKANGSNSVSSVIAQLKTLTENSIFIDGNTNVAPYKNQLVHIIKNE
ncbi:MAG: hypothetical protein AAGB24_02360 [Bacteroidota bacterium]